MNLKQDIINGPYLLALNTTNVTIAWDMEILEDDIQLIYRTNENQYSAAVNYEQEPVCKGSAPIAYLYTVRLEQLIPDADYEYDIYLGEKILSTGYFHTLAENPQKIRIITLSDSHLFNTHKEFSAVVEREKPNLLVHSGDISFGTGYQKEQYEQNWFRKIPELLRCYGIYYVPGNHDDGIFFESFFAKLQCEYLNSKKDGYTYSFDYGDVHFTMVDSNSWGLFEMNAVNSGLATDEETKKQIFSTLKWIDEDLNSPRAKTAKWRIMVLHHPYTDIFNNKYIVPIVEKNNVNLVISGHLHYYTKAVSVNPELGAKTVYISQGSLQEPDFQIEKNQQDKRLLVDFPEVVALGKSNYGLLEITKDTLSYKLYGFDKAGKSCLVDDITMTKQATKLAITDVQLRRLDNLGNVEIRANVENLTNNVVVAKLDLYDNGKLKIINLFGNKENRHIVLLNKGEIQALSAIYQAKEQGEHKLKIADKCQDIIVYEPSQLSFENMKIFVGKNKDCNKIIASIEATNNLDRESLVSIPLYINQRIAETKNVFFRGHEKKYLEFQYRFDKNGNYQVSIGDQLPKNIQIEGGIRIIPRIHDKSGNGHYGLLHGNPKVVSNHGHTQVYLEQYGDYIEIPVQDDLTVDNAFCGMVWANIDRLAKEHEMGHNPLMVKGKSVGWGATYLLRMVVERAGGLKWGICHDITEYSWQGGHAKLGEMTHYTMSFDKSRGGNSYVDGKCVAHVAGIGKNDILRQWVKEPIFIGYSYIGHVIAEIDRPKYFTHLPAKINQVRFYKSNISAKDNKYIGNNPYNIGPKDKDLIIWLDFKDILTVGKHVTKWRHPVIFNPEFKTEKIYWQYKQLKVVANIPLQANVKTIVEVSDDGVIVKDSLPILLKDGTNYVDLSLLKQAQYIRIITDLSGEVGAEGTFVPEVKEYQITAYHENIFTDIYWSTRTDWEEGTFTGAVGFAPIDRLREYPEYTDIIHG